MSNCPYCNAAEGGYHSMQCPNQSGYQGASQYASPANYQNGIPINPLNDSKARQDDLYNQLHHARQEIQALRKTIDILEVKMTGMCEGDLVPKALADWTSIWEKRIQNVEKLSENVSELIEWKIFEVESADGDFTKGGLKTRIERLEKASSAPAQEPGSTCSKCGTYYTEICADLHEEHCKRLSRTVAQEPQAREASPFGSFAYKRLEDAVVECVHEQIIRQTGNPYPTMFLCDIALLCDMIRDAVKDAAKKDE